MLSDTVTEEHVADVISRSTGIPLGSLLQGESERLLRMEEVLKESVVGQVGCVVMWGWWTIFFFNRLLDRTGGMERAPDRMDDPLRSTPLHFTHQIKPTQDQAVHAIANCVRLSRAGLRAHDRPVGVFLFLGPTGVGKTHVTKRVTEFLFNDERAMVRCFFLCG